MSPAADRLGSALADRYVIERELGQGGMATVYLAEDLKHDRRVAVKVLRPELAAVIGADRFLTEIKTTANLQHPHILPLHDSGEADGFLFYVMPFVEGETVRDRLNKEKQLPVAEAVRIATEVAAALDYAHRHNVIHRDIKPENILLHDGSALVADFGIALAASKAGGTRMTETGMSLGTPHYMSPEQAMGEREITARSDVYALGCVTYEMLMGEPPFTGPTAQAIIAKVMTDAPHAMTLHRNTVPPQVEAAVLQALQKLPADRFGTAAEFATALTSTTYTRPMTGIGYAPSGGAGRWRSVALAAGAAAVACAVIAFWALLRRAPDGPVTRVSIAFPEGERLRTTPTRRLALSPDGSRVVYVGPDSLGTRLWVRELSSLTARPLTGTSSAVAPFFSPDGQSIAFFTGSPGDLRVTSGARRSPWSGIPPIPGAATGARMASSTSTTPRHVSRAFPPRAGPLRW
jgi:serine/threonine-protein kinase